MTICRMSPHSKWPVFAAHSRSWACCWTRGQKSIVPRWYATPPVCARGPRLRLTPSRRQHLALINAREDVCTLLIQRMVTVVDDVWSELLMAAALRSNVLSVCQLLIQRGLVVTWNVWKYCCNGGVYQPTMPTLRFMFERSSFDWNQRDVAYKCEGFTLLHLTAYHGVTTAVEFLLSLSSCRTVLGSLTYAHETPLAVARRRLLESQSENFLGDSRQIGN